MYLSSGDLLLDRRGGGSLALDDLLFLIGGGDSGDLALLKPFWGDLISLSMAGLPAKFVLLIGSLGFLLNFMPVALLTLSFNSIKLSNCCETILVAINGFEVGFCWVSL